MRYGGIECSAKRLNAYRHSLDRARFHNAHDRNEIMVVPVRKQLLEALRSIDRPGTFCTSGLLPSIHPGLEIVGAGAVALPLAKKQANVLKKLAHLAPYGKGTQTLFDMNVRRVWEIDAEQVAFTNPDWAGVVEQSVHVVQSELGLKSQKLNAHLYKLLLYEPGSFFQPHRDGEKLDRMVATMVIALPSAHKGGELIVRHDGQEIVVDFGPESSFKTQYAAFYTDCEHEVRPVTSGFRLALVYNLTLTKPRSKKSLSAPSQGQHIASLARVLKPWAEELRGLEGILDPDEDPSMPTKLAVLLDHEYTPAGLTHDALKGLDRTKADVLFSAARQAACDAYLALVVCWESGAADPSSIDFHGYDRYRSRYDDYDEEDEEFEDDYEDSESEYEMEEVYDQTLIATVFSDANGNAFEFEQIPLSESGIVSESPLNDGVPDRQDYEGYTGNEGMTLERWYHRAAILLWPTVLRFDILCEAGMPSAVAGLEGMVKQWAASGKQERPALLQDCLEFARRIIANWPKNKYSQSYNFNAFFSEKEDSPRSNSDGSQDSTRRNVLLEMLNKLGDRSLIRDWFPGVLAKDASVDPGRTLGMVCKEHGWLTFKDELLRLFKDTSNETVERHAQLLADWSLLKGKAPDRDQLCAELGQELMSAVERWNPNRSQKNWEACSVSLPDLITLLVKSFVKTNQMELFDRLVSRLLDHPKEFDFTHSQIPALLQLQSWLQKNVQSSCPPLSRWLKAVLSELEARAARPPKKPSDWRRKYATGCKCEDCQKLSRFLKDPNTETLRFPLATDRRRHLHVIIEENMLDTTHVTERRGRPYVLVLRKTEGTHERAMNEHRLDLEQLKKIQRMLDWYNKQQ